MKKLGVIIVLLSVLSASSVMAHDRWRVDHSCYEPSKPYEFTSQWEIDDFNREVEDYRMCIQQFIDEQNDAIRNHSRAAEEAASEWNNFVSFELN